MAPHTVSLAPISARVREDGVAGLFLPGREHGEVNGDQLPLVGLLHEALHVLLEALYLVEIEPMPEAVFRELVGLGVYPGVGERMLEGRVDALDLEKGAQRRLPEVSVRNCSLLPLAA